MIKKQINKITIVNAHWNNRGDEAALLALLAGLQKRYKYPEITVFIKDDDSVLLFPALKNTQCFPMKFNAKIGDIWLSVLTQGILGNNSILKKTIKIIRGSDLIIYSPGGSVINDRFFWRKQMEYLVPFMCSRFYKIPMFVAAPSMGPFDLIKKNRIRSWLLKTPDVICVREAISQKYLEQIGIKKNVHVTMDLAFMNQIDMKANEIKLKQDKNLDLFLKFHQKIIGMTITDFKWHIKLRKETVILNQIEETCQQFIEQSKKAGYGILLIPQLFGNQNDSDYLKNFENDNTFLLNEEMDSYFQQFIISKLYAVIGLRYHSNIFAAKMSIPFIPIVYEEKMKGFLEIANWESYAIPLEEISCEKLNERFHLLELNYHNIQNHLKKDILLWKKNALKTLELLPD